MFLFSVLFFLRKYLSQPIIFVDIHVRIIFEYL